MLSILLIILNYTAYQSLFDVFYLRTTFYIDSRGQKNKEENLPHEPRRKCPVNHSSWYKQIREVTKSFNLLIIGQM